MKVLTTGLEWFTERPGGLPRYFADYTASLARNGDEVRALVGTAAGIVGSVPPYVGGIRTRQAGTVRIRRMWRAAVAREITHSNYDLFNPHFAYYAWGALNVPELGDMPIVTHFHGPWAYESSVGKSGMQSHLRFLLQKHIERRVYRSTDRFIVLSDCFRQILIDDYGVPTESVHVVPGAVDINRFQQATDREQVRSELKLPQNRRILVSVRRLVRRMGLENLIRAIEVLKDDFPDILLVIVGTGPLKDELRSMIVERKLEHHVCMAGRVPDADLPKYYQSADLSVVPTMALEGFGLITAESLACGTPTLGTPVGGTKEILNRFDGRLLLPGIEVAHLVQGIGQALTHQANLPSADVCRAYVLENYTWDVIVPQIRGVFLAALANRSQRKRGYAVHGTVTQEGGRA